MLGVVVHTYNPSPWEAEARTWHQGQSGLQSETLRQAKQNKTKKGDILLKIYSISPRALAGSRHTHGSSRILESGGQGRNSHWALWLIPVIPATWEAEIRRTEVWGQPEQIVLETSSPK
jgi:hypothetical protein